MNAWQSALSSFGRIKSDITNRARNIWQKAEPEFKRVVTAIPQSVAAKNIQPRPSLTQLTQPVRQSLKNVALDLPFYTSRLQTEIGRRFLPHEPYGFQMMPSSFKVGKGKIGPDFSTPSETVSSAEPLPFLDYPKSTPELETLKQNVIKAAGFRPAAQKYFQSVPVFPLAAGRGPAFSVMTEMNPAVAMEQPLPQQYNPEQTMLHELLHVAPRVILRGANPYEDYLRAYNQTKSLKGIMISYGGPEMKIEKGYPLGFPGTEEAFATIGETLGQSAPYAPTIGKYYEGIFQPGVTPIKQRQFMLDIPTLLEQQWQLEAEEKKRKGAKK